MTRTSAIAILAFWAVLLAGCGSLFPPSYRFRMTVQIDTPQGLRTGSSVLEVSSQLQNLPGRGVTPLTMLTGEAVAVDPSEGRTLFALIGELSNGGNLGQEITELFEPDVRGSEAFVASVKKLARSDQVGRNVIISPEQYPKLVTFRDSRDATSIEVIDPGNAAGSFGPGTTLRRITVTITHDDVTTGIEDRLPWLEKQRGSLISAVSGDPLPRRKLANITEVDFSTGVLRWFEQSQGRYACPSVA